MMWRVAFVRGDRAGGRLTSDIWACTCTSPSRPYSLRKDFERIYVRLRCLDNTVGSVASFRLCLLIN
jgi:hypothetical protein